MITGNGRLLFRYLFVYLEAKDYRGILPGDVKKDGRILVLAAAIITGLRLARDPRAGCLTERVIDAVEDGLFLANHLYDKALLRFGQGNIDFKW
jgi:hypothetical protein